MKTQAITRRVRLGTAWAALAIALGGVSATAPAIAQPTSAKPAETLTLSKGTGTLVRLSEPMSDVFIANDSVALDQPRSSLMGVTKNEKTPAFRGDDAMFIRSATPTMTQP